MRKSRRKEGGLNGREDGNRYRTMKESTKCLILTSKSFQENLQTFRTIKNEYSAGLQDTRLTYIHINREKYSS